MAKLVLSKIGSALVLVGVILSLIIMLSCGIVDEWKWERDNKRRRKARKNGGPS